MASDDAVAIVGGGGKTSAMFRLAREVVQSGGRVCSGARVDVVLVQPERADLPLGSLVSDARGEFRGNLVIPWNAALGEHTLTAIATGCAPRGRGVR